MSKKSFVLCICIGAILLGNPVFAETGDASSGNLKAQGPYDRIGGDVQYLMDIREFKMETVDRLENKSLSSKSMGAESVVTKKKSRVLTEEERLQNYLAGDYVELIVEFAHELGHDLKHLPDLYLEPHNVSFWGLMARGSKLGEPQGSTPAHFSAWSKKKLGWLEIDIHNYRGST